jgi:hypothetical protein
MATRRSLSSESGGSDGARTRDLRRDRPGQSRTKSTPIPTSMGPKTAPQGASVGTHPFNESGQTLASLTAEATHDLKHRGHNCFGVPTQWLASTFHSQPTRFSGATPKGIGIKEPSVKRSEPPFGRGGLHGRLRTLGGSFLTRRDRDRRRIGVVACRQKEAARKQADRLTQA